MNRSDVEDIKTFSALFAGEQTDQGTQDIKSCLGMIIKIAKAYSGLGVAMADLLQSGAIGVLEARAAFVPGTIGRTGNVVSFPTFAWYHIKRRVSECAGKNEDANKDASMQAIIYEDVELADTIADTADVLEDVITREDEGERRALLDSIPALFDRLTPIERAIMTEWLETNSLRSAGAKWNLSHESAREIKDRALKKMRAANYPIQLGLL